MVRRNELACRDEWSRSLWQPRDSQHSNGDTPFQRPVLGPLPPVLAENLQSVLNGDAALAAASNGDFMTSVDQTFARSSTHYPFQNPYNSEGPSSHPPLRGVWSRGLSVRSS